MAKIEQTQCVVVGAGPAGLVAALALAAAGVEVVLIAPVVPDARPDPAGPGSRGSEDGRTAALFGPSITLLANLGVWARLAPACAPLRAIRIVDDRDALLRAPEVLFEAREIGLDVLGYNVGNEALTGVLWDAVRKHTRVRVLAGHAVAGVEIGDADALVRLTDGRLLRAGLVAAADGRSSICRGAAGIAARTWDYDQSALATRFQHVREHHDVSTELHAAGGPLTTVPLPGRASSLVWVERTEVAKRLAALSPDTLARALETRLHGLLGAIGDVAPPRIYPLSGLVAEVAGRNRVALVGEAGHVIPPIGAQGLNLGLRDAAALADVVADGKIRGEDVGGASALATYAHARAGDIEARTLAVDLLNRSLTSGLLPLDLARGAGLHMLGGIPALKRALMQRGLGTAGPLPRLMQSQCSLSPARAGGGDPALPAGRRTVLNLFERESRSRALHSRTL